jgi:hypothetical protein
MRERPILFSAPMVRAILEGRKTQTRRIVVRAKDGELPLDFHDGMFWFADGDAQEINCPYGETGDRLWIREAWRTEFRFNHLKPSLVPGTPLDTAIYYEADGKSSMAGKYRHSRFMPRRFSRTALDITKVRVQRLQEISEQDAIAEGVEKLGEFPNITPYRNYMVKQPAGAHNFSTSRASFMSLWSSINGTESYTANPLVWAITFPEVKP